MTNVPLQYEKYLEKYKKIFGYYYASQNEEHREKIMSENLDHKVIYFDESGNTEKGIKDAAQLFITFASIKTSEEDCKFILQKEFPQYRDKEIKYNDVKNQKDKVLHVLKALKNNNAKFKIFIVYKPFFLFRSLITAFYEDALEFIGANDMACDPDFRYLRDHNFWFHYLCFHGEEFLTKLIFAYQELVLGFSNKNFDKLHHLTKEKSDAGCPITKLIYSSLDRLKSHGTKEPFSPYLKMKNNLIFRDHHLLWVDTVLSCTTQLFSQWSHDLREPLDIIHDNSWSLEKKKNLLKAFENSEPLSPIQSKIDPKLQFFPISYSLKNKGIRFEDSKKYYGLQAADLLAGAINECVKSMYLEKSIKLLELFDQISNLFIEKDFLTIIPNREYFPENLTRYLPPNLDFLCAHAVASYIRNFSKQ